MSRARPHGGALALACIAALGIGFAASNSATARAAVDAKVGTAAPVDEAPVRRASPVQRAPDASARVATAQRFVRVVAFDTGSTIPHATITVHARASRSTFTKAAPSGALAVVATDDDLAAIEAPGFAARHLAGAELRDGATVALRPLANRPIDVPVRDVHGAPIVDARVCIQLVPESRTLEARTDATGLARFVLPGGTQSIYFEGRVSAHGYTHAAFAGLDNGSESLVVTTELRAERAAAVVLHGKGELRAVVVDERGAPRSDARLTVRPATGRADSSCDGGYRSERVWTAHTDGGGRVAIDALPVGVALDWIVEGEALGTFELTPGASMVTLAPAGA